jgi:hypothetical protein
MQGLVGLFPYLSRLVAGPDRQTESMPVDVRTWRRLVADAVVVNSCLRSKSPPVDSRSERMAIGVLEPSDDQRIVVPLKK